MVSRANQDVKLILNCRLGLTEALANTYRTRVAFTWMMGGVTVFTPTFAQAMEIMVDMQDQTLAKR